jgi:hypothetical protein
MYPRKYMQVNGLQAQINTPDALVGDGVHGLPPHNPVEFYPVDEYPACPKNWMHGSDKASSYFVPVQVGKGMWFDFTPNQSHKHHVAVVISVQGINPVTGQQITNLNLQQFKKQCPKHNIDFQQDRYCPECQYKWPAQNYIATTTGETLWIDGFRNTEGLVEQYILTEEKCRGIAAQLIGEDRVWAIGFAFYLSKDAKPEIPAQSVRICSIKPGQYQNTWNAEQYQNTWNGLHYHDAAPSEYQAFGFINNSSIDPGPSGSVLRSAPTNDYAMEVEEVEAGTKVEIGAGAKIEQELGIDPNNIDFWQEEPIGMIYVNYVTPDTCQQILNVGKRQDKQNGFLENLRTGN